MINMSSEIERIGNLNVWDVNWLEIYSFVIAPFKKYEIHIIEYAANSFDAYSSDKYDAKAQLYISDNSPGQSEGKIYSFKRILLFEGTVAECLGFAEKNINKNGGIKK